MTGRSRVRIPAGPTDFLFKRPHSMLAGGSCPGRKLQHSPPSSAEARHTDHWSACAVRSCTCSVRKYTCAVRSCTRSVRKCTCSVRNYTCAFRYYTHACPLQTVQSFWRPVRRGLSSLTTSMQLRPSWKAEIQDSLPYSQERATGLCAEGGESSCHVTIHHFFKICVMS